MKKRLSAYWWCQIGGWSFTIIANVINGVFNPFSWSYRNISTNIFFFRVLIISLLGIIISHFMRWVIIRWYILQKKINYQIVYLLLINLGFSIQYSFFTLGIFKIVGLLKNNEITFTFLPLMYGSTIYSFLVLLVWNLIYFSYHYIEKSRKALIEKIRFENELQLQKLESEKTKAEQKLESEKAKAEMQRESTELQIKAMVATQEQERKRISRDLHDDVGTKLSALNLYLSSLNEKAIVINNDEIRSLAQSSKQFIKEAMHDVRQLLFNLSPTVLEEFGYTTAVEGLINKINETKQIHFDLVVFGINHRLKKEYELALYRITQELINNVLKHAEAKYVSLQIGQRDEKIILMMEDDGKGFDVTTHKDGYGLNNLDARTKLMQGIMTIDSQPGKGTSVLVKIPYNFNGV